MPETGDSLPGPNTVIVAGWVAAPRPQHLQKRHSRINLTDPEARVMKGRHQAWWYRGIVAGYNAQTVVSARKTEEGTSGILVTAVDVVRGG